RWCIRRSWTERGAAAYAGNTWWSRGYSPALLEFPDQVTKTLWNHIETLQQAPLFHRNVWCDRHEVHSPTREATVCSQEALAMLLECFDRSRQAIRGALAGTKSKAALVLPYDDQIDLHITSIPVATHALGEREVTDATPAALLV